MEYKPRLLMGIRPVKQEQFYLSPHYGSDVICIDTFIFSNEERLKENLLNIYKDLEARFHFGKFIPVEGDYFAGIYEEWSEIKKLRKLYDPYNIFYNEFAQKLEV